MPQEIPLEASETLAFTPESLAVLGPDAPSFELRAMTRRDKRFHSRLMVEEGVRPHNGDAMRAEILTGLKAVWSEDDFEKHSPIIKAYWEALDDHALALKADPNLVFTYDQDIVRAIDDLVQRVADAWQPLRRMMADNADFNRMLMPIMAVVAVKSWKNVTTPARFDRGYLTLDCVEALEEEMEEFDKKAGAKPGTSFTELFIACAGRMNLGQEEAKNSESPSLSDTNPPASKVTHTSDKDGSSPESTATEKTETSVPTPETA